MKGKSCPFTKLCWALVLIGALNWGLVGIFEWNLVNAIFGSVAWLERLIYVLVGLAAIWVIIRFSQCCKKGECKGGSCKGGSCKGGSCGGSK